MPYGLEWVTIQWQFHPQECFNPSYGLHALRASWEWVGTEPEPGFNPSYGLHALRANYL